MEFTHKILKAHRRKRKGWGKPQTYQNISVKFDYIIAYVHIKKDVTIIRNHQPQKEGIWQFM